MVHHSFAHIISISRQTGKSDSCTMENLEDVWDVHDRENIIFLGWIHTHPEYDVFLSRFCLTHPTINFVKVTISNLFSDHSCSFFSVDMHNQYEWQHMLPEALAIVCRCRNHKDYATFIIFVSTMLHYPYLHVSNWNFQSISSIKFDKTGFLSLTEAGLQEIGKCDQVTVFCNNQLLNILFIHPVCNNFQFDFLQGELPPAQQGTSSVWRSNSRGSGSREQGHPQGPQIVFYGA